MIDREHVLNQGIAIFNIVFGAICVGVGSKCNWAELKALGAGVTGAGIQSITSQIKQSLTAQRGAQLNVNPTDPTVTST